MLILKWLLPLFKKTLLKVKAFSKKIVSLKITFLYWESVKNFFINLIDFVFVILMFKALTTFTNKIVLDIIIAIFVVVEGWF